MRVSRLRHCEEPKATKQSPPGMHSWRRLLRFARNDAAILIGVAATLFLAAAPAFAQCYIERGQVGLALQIQERAVLSQVLHDLIGTARRRPMHGGEEATMAKLSARRALIDQLTTVSKERVGNPMAASTTKTLYD